MSVFTTHDLPNVSIDQSGKIKALPKGAPGMKRKGKRATRRGGKR